MTAAPTFANGYDGTLPNGVVVEQGLGNMRTLAQLLELETVAKAHPESRRRHIGVWLYAYDNGVPAGPGTFWRSPAQQSGVVGGAPVWASWHQGRGPKPQIDVDGQACDNVPASFQHWWAARQGFITQTFGLCIYRTTTDRSAWNVEGRSYGAGSTQEYWHSQLWECMWGRGNPTSKPGNFPLGGIKRWAIPRKYDIDVVGVEFWRHPLWTGEQAAPDPVPVPPDPFPDHPVPTPQPSSDGDDDMKFRGYYSLAGQVGIWCVYDGPIKCKTHVPDLDAWRQLADQLKGAGIVDVLGRVPEPETLIVTPDVAGFRALGPILGTVPAGCDAFGVAG